MCSQNAGNAISETHILEISWEDMPQTPLADSCLRYSAHTFGDRILSWGGGQGKWALWQFCPTTEESLKNALTCLAIFINVGHIFMSAPNFSPLKYKDKVDIKFLFLRINSQTIVFPSRYLPVRKCVLESIH